MEMMPVCVHVFRIMPSVLPRGLVLAYGSSWAIARFHDNNRELIEAIRDCQLNHVATVLHSEADPNARDRNGMTALKFALNLGRTEVVGLLMARGAHE
jgi:ankyrin repeat protein